MTLKDGKVLITGYAGFTGKLLGKRLLEKGYEVFGLTMNEPKLACEYQVDITDYVQLQKTIATIKPDYVIHLAAISTVTHQGSELFYKVNLLGALNLLEALAEARVEPQKVIMASSAYVYGNSSEAKISETVVPKPINHYGVSKLAMEHMAATWFDRFSILITRPFNYTGVGQELTFLIPKIVKNFHEQRPFIELGNMDVIRDISDVNFVIDCYLRLLESNVHSEIFNICSGTGYSIMDILEMMCDIAGYRPEIKKNAELVRKSEIHRLVGSNRKLFTAVGEILSIPLSQTLTNMFSTYLAMGAATMGDSRL